MLSRSALVRTRWTLAFVVEHIERDRDPPPCWRLMHRAELDDAFCRALECWSEARVPSVARAAYALSFPVVGYRVQE